MERGLLSEYCNPPLKLEIVQKTHVILLLVFHIGLSYWYVLFKSFQIIHWRVHKEECERFAEQMRRVNLLSQFPFTFLEPPALVLLCTPLFSFQLRSFLKH